MLESCQNPTVCRRRADSVKERPTNYSNFQRFYVHFIFLLSNKQQKKKADIQRIWKEKNCVNFQDFIISWRYTKWVQSRIIISNLHKSSSSSAPFCSHQERNSFFSHSYSFGFQSIPRKNTITDYYNYKVKYKAIYYFDCPKGGKNN